MNIACRYGNEANCFYPVLVEKLKIEIRELESKLDVNKTEVLMPCGHGTRFLYSSDEGTNYCEECARIVELKAVAERCEALKAMWVKNNAKEGGIC